MAPDPRPLSSRDVRRAPMLDARAATRCPLRTHLRIEPPADAARVAPDPGALARMADGRAFEDQVMAEITAEVGPIPTGEDPDALAGAMAAGVPLIAQATLRDPVGRRTGRPDLLLALREPTAEGRTAYLPIEIKAHLVTQGHVGGSLGAFTGVPATHVGRLDPTALVPAEDRWTRRKPDDMLQLAHYHRLLEHLGHAGPPLGGVIGSERLLALVDLDTPVFQSWRTATGRWTTLQKYDREFGFRLDVAALAVDRVAGVTDEPPLVVPARSGECGTCENVLWCQPRMEAADELTLLPGISWDVRQRLHAAGITTRAALAQAERSALPSASVRTAADQARVQAAGIGLARRRDAGPLVLPRAAVEVDVDMESTPDGRVYLWGCLVNDARGGRYVPFADFSADLDDHALFGRFWGWLQQVQATAAAAGGSFAAYCYAAAGAENRYLRLYGPAAGADVEGLIASERWVDLHRVVADHVLTGGSTGLKAVAGRLGFRWRDEDPGGDASMRWYADAVAGDVVQQQRLLDYNEDDVRATVAVRDGLTSRWASLPSVRDL